MPSKKLLTIKTVWSQCTKVFLLVFCVPNCAKQKKYFIHAFFKILHIKTSFLQCKICKK